MNISKNEVFRYITKPEEFGEYFLCIGVVVEQWTQNREVLGSRTMQGTLTPQSTGYYPENGGSVPT